MGTTSPQPRLAYRAGAVYLDTHAGVLAQLDAETGELEWGYGYPTEPVQASGRIIFIGGMMRPEARIGQACPYTPGQNVDGVTGRGGEGANGQEQITLTRAELVELLTESARLFRR